jgi:multiple sugar transport system substrate-binding protein
MKKIMSIVLVMGMIMSLFVGCAKETQTTTQEEPTAVKEESKAATETTKEEAVTAEPVKLIVWGGVPGESGPQNLVDAWNAKNPNIQVEYVRFVNDETGNTKLDTGILSGEQIDLFFTYSVDLMKKRTDSGMLVDLAEFNAEEFIKENIAGAGEGIVRINDKLYSIPTATEPAGIMLNKRMLDEAGITVPNNWTYDDFVEITKKLTKEVDGKKVYGTHTFYAGLPLNIAQTVLGSNHMYSNDGKASNFDAKEFVYNVKLKELMDQGYAMPYEEIISRQLEAYSQSVFLAEEVAMMPFSAWMLRYVKDLENYPHDFVATFAPFPTTEKGVANNYQAALNNFICMNSDSKYKQEAWEFMKYWLTEGSEFMLTAGKIPVWKNADSGKVTDGILGADAEKLFDVEAYTKVMLNPELQFIVDTYTTAYSQITQIYKEENEMYFLGATTLEEYLNNIKTRADEAIAKESN